MFKKLFAALTLLIALPAFANAAVWTVKATSANSTFGTVSPAGYTNLASTTPSQAVIVTPGANYQVSSIMVNSVDQKVGTAAQTVIVPMKAGTSIVVANFVAKGFTVKAGACTNGSISSTGAQTVNAGGSKSFTVTPFSGYKILTVADNGAPVTLDPSNVYTVSNVQENHTITATFGGVTANAGLNQNAVVGHAVSLTGTGTAPGTDVPTYQWTVTYAPAGSSVTTATVFNAAAASFTADKAGTYNLKLKVTDGDLSATSTVAVTAFATLVDAANASANACASCHSDKGAFLTSAHTPTANANFATATSAVGCNTCHVSGTLLGMDAPVPTAATLCIACHTDNAPVQGLVQAQNWANGLHNKANNHFEQIYCNSCHDSHGLVATATNDKTDSCAACHTDQRSVGGGNYSIYSSASRLVLKAPHGGGVATSSVGGDGTTQYLTQGAICTDCHGHNNAINAGFAEGGHGEVSSDALNPFAHYDWSTKGNTTSRANGNCTRCHTAYGFMKFANQTTGMTRLQLKTGQANNVLICIGCHKTTEGELRTDAVPAGGHGPLSGGYFALFSSSKAIVAADKTKIEIAFPGLQNSSICVPCHAGRSTAAVFVAVIDKANTAPLGNYSTISTSYYQHAKNVGQNFISQGAYDITGKLAAITTNGPSAHAAVKMTGADDQGPCVGCHYSTTTATHSLAVDNTSPTCINTNTCHTTAPDVAGAKANFDAGVAALTALIHAKFDPLMSADSARGGLVGPLDTERAPVRFGRFGKAPGVAADAATAKAAYGAWFNWQILATYDNAAYAHNPRYARQILNDTLGFLQTGVVKTSYAGADVAAAIAAGQTAGTITAAQATAANGFITAPGCAACHADKVTTFTTAGGYHFVTKQYSCNNCHTELHQNTAAATQPTCRCHGDVAGTATPVQDALNATGANCAQCHTTLDVHSMTAPTRTGCVNCHAIAIAYHDKNVNDNNGVRQITGATGEFGGNVNKRSHHIVNAGGGDPTDAQCLACHAEGTVVAGAVVIDTNFHKKSNLIYLRNGGGIPDTQLAKEIGGNKSVTISSVSVFPWNPATPDHNLMDQFCFSCHNANGAPVAAAAIVAALPGATASNPFADSISNGYDQMARGKVVNAFGQFSTGNASHHAVRGKRYSGKTRTAGDPRVVGKAAVYDGTNASVAFTTMSSATMGAGDGKAGPGVRKTLFDAGFFSTSYSPLGSTGAMTTLGDDSTLHCGDCHTVGQWKSGSSMTANGTATTVVIGAHGSQNEYLLRNSAGTDALHNANGSLLTDMPQATDSNTVAMLVCYNCHAFSRYGALGKHQGVNSGGDCNTDKWTNSVAGLIGSARLGRVAPFTSSAAGSNMFAIQCANCHNSGAAAQFGGIHGGNISYTDGTGVTQKPYRFLPGLSNVKYAPNNHQRNDGVTTFGPSAPKGQNTPEYTTSWEEKTIFTGSRATCYTLNTAASAPAVDMTNPATDSYAAGQPVLGTWGACTDHGGSSIGGGHGGPRDIQRPLTY